MRNQNFNRFLFLVIFMSPWLAFISWCNSVLPREIKLCISLCHAFDDVVKKRQPNIVETQFIGFFGYHYCSLSFRSHLLHRFLVSVFLILFTPTFNFFYTSRFTVLWRFILSGIIDWKTGSWKAKPYSRKISSR